MTIPFSRVRAWMFETALPFWAANGIDKAHGGVLETLDFAGQPSGVAFKRLRVASRQVYSFAHAAELGWAPGKDLAHQIFADMARQAWLGPEQGWARRLTREGAVLDASPDLYDLAFALFACAWALKATAAPKAHALGHATLDFIEAKMAHPTGLGFHHALPATGPRLQNPHMHLCEAGLAAYAATGETRFADLARKMAGLCLSHFNNADSGALYEYFDADWRPVQGDEGRLVEPGHQLEWAWILAQCQTQLGLDVGDRPEMLVASAERFGVDMASGATFNAVRDDGTVIDGGSRTWPNTERLKGLLAIFERGGPLSPGIAQTTELLLNRYLAVAPAGTWMDTFDADGRPAAKDVPASTLYHVFLAFAELLRLEPKLKATRA